MTLKIKCKNCGAPMKQTRTISESIGVPFDGLRTFDCTKCLTYLTETKQFGVGIWCVVDIPREPQGAKGPRKQG
jgi:hypothetical protein